MAEREISRRTLLAGAAAGAVGLAVGSPFGASSAQAASFINGADISWAQQMSAGGYTWKNASGTAENLFTILAGYGIGAVRLRTWVNPSSDPVNGHCSISETAAMAVQAKGAGMSVLLDFHFGDTWNSVGVQNPPAAWASMTYSGMLTAMYNYVYHSMNVLKYDGIYPEWVQIGNEINSGICHPVGGVSRPAQMTGLLNAAHDMVKEVSPNSQVCVHLAQPQNYASMETFFSAYSGNGGKWDMSVFSSYGSASEAAGIVANMAEISAAYGKPFMQAEFGGSASSPGSTEKTLEAYLIALKAKGGLGLFYWEPEVYSPFDSYGSGAWDASTREPTVIMDGFAAA
ncbi:glycosyl hydrolase 53 family protein [Actinospica sp.]|uniref:glycosyl hydrolase 53 family protein n=1 Tax=Actinospica sp. TaxID=1872142 RepID=UPI002B886A6C|nr:glycosyl hydrolase 53 family protein [Actinospica sp.]HWG25612.1 glycosyl hydrolase 53 family protein [Actinospica sp.]